MLFRSASTTYTESNTIDKSRKGKLRLNPRRSGTVKMTIERIVITRRPIMVFLFTVDLLLKNERVKSYLSTNF